MTSKETWTFMAGLGALIPTVFSIRAGWFVSLTTGAAISAWTICSILAFLAAWMVVGVLLRVFPERRAYSLGLFTLLGAALLHAAAIISVFFPTLGMGGLLLFSPMLPLFPVLVSCNAQTCFTIDGVDVGWLIITGVIPACMALFLSGCFRAGERKKRDLESNRELYKK